MYKRLLCLLFFNSCLFTAFCQLSVSLHEPPAGIVQKNQLWNITLIYSGTVPTNITIGLSLFDVNDNQAVMTAFTRPMLLTNGIKQLQASDVGPVDYNYLSPAFDISRLPDAFLPIGNYRACYTFYNSKNSEGALMEDCINLVVEPLSPPQLNLPSDSALIENPFPQFNWLPPTPATLFSSLNYDLLVAEVQPGQTPEDAIQENLPVYTALHLTSVANNYPTSNKSLDTGKLYAWRVIAKNAEMFAAQSEVWTFSIHNKKQEQLVPSQETYLELKTDNGYITTGIIPDNILRIKYYSYDKTHDAVVRFLNERGEVVKEIGKTIQYGNNFIVFTLDHSFRKETTYFVEINDLQMSRYKTSFRISK